MRANVTQRYGCAVKGESDMPLGQQMEGRATSSGLDSPVRTKVAIVTGASRGIGRGIAERLLETGYRIIDNIVHNLIFCPQMARPVE